MDKVISDIDYTPQFSIENDTYIEDHNYCIFDLALCDTIFENSYVRRKKRL